MRVLITGGTGVISSHITKHLLAKNQHAWSEPVFCKARRLERLQRCQPGRGYVQKILIPGS